MSALPARTDVVVIGGGVIGTSIACQLAEAGVDTVLLERGALGSGSSANTAGVVRSYFPGSPLTSSLAVRSTEAYHAFAERTGTDLGLQRVGFLELFTEERQVEAFRRDRAAQHAAGVAVELVTAAEAARLNPLLDDQTVVGAAWSPEAYACDPAAIVRGYATAAERAGALVRTHTPVTGIDPDGRVHTSAGSIRADTVVCAAGPWADQVADLAGVRLPVTTYPIELLLTDAPRPAPRAPLPMTLHPTSLRIRTWGDRILVGMGRPGTDESREAWLGRVARQLGATYPSLAGRRLERGWSGDLDVSPDGTAFIGRDPSRPFVYAAGFSGQGLCQAPAAGEIVRDLLLGKQPWTDIAGLATARCTGGPAPSPADGEGTPS
ncbi:4-methylaminobutanoate oxidase (formaldehyde-forming) [Streptomyces sp. YIM 130001]|uniref:NAD(P)/FAD-dependent oxidoreductase n=1 Tax=Streptomyces sp. YIM 130001 TaxID=2259644 RepID=UPI000E64A4FD|nr:FAD-dependent oxidoreductase [Streptomyces sp. YIM 130001]RII20950.1 4-methylaminobutanoate oxidase (formaldehyde-forming) [Streptomyces sp. YIM 130001]